MSIPVYPLGQSGFRFQFGEVIIYTDPYLSEHVADLEGLEMKRMCPIRFEPADIKDADFVLISHAHIDHCDLKTLLPLAAASPRCMFIAPREVTKLLSAQGIASGRLVAAPEAWIPLANGLRVRPVPAAHTEVERDESGYLRFLGYVLDYRGSLIYHAGDTSPDTEIFEVLKDLGPIDVALLPVNERNFFRDRRGIIGNMSVREAFQMAEEIGTKTLVPMHWDMFAPNCVYREEIELLYRLMKPPFAMVLEPQEIL